MAVGDARGGREVRGIEVEHQVAHRRANFAGTSRSTLAPLGMRPLLGTFDGDLRAVLAVDAEAADDHAALGERIHLRRRRRAAASSAGCPPRRLEALPMEATVTSIVCPGLAKGGRSAVTVTAATFFSCGLVPAGMVTPNFASMLVMLWMVNGAWRGLVAGAVETDDEAVADELVGSARRPPWRCP